MKKLNLSIGNKNYRRKMDSPYDVVMIPMENLEYNKARNTEDRMNRKLKGCSLTARVHASIQEIGLQNPLVVEKRGENRYGVLLGANRLVSLKALGWTEVPCIITPDSSVETLKKIRKTYKRIKGLGV
jgi:hypothetical protein